MYAIYKENENSELETKQPFKSTTILIIVGVIMIITAEQLEDELNTNH